MLGSGKELYALFYLLITERYLGAFGEVRMCVHRDTGAQRAVKVLRKSHMDDDEKKMLFNEINILRGLVSILIFRCSFFEHTSHYTQRNPPPVVKSFPI
jgi:serine/threonine protein kinase